MEIREVTQIKIYKLYLNDMRIGELDLAAISYNKDLLMPFLLSEMVDPYTESEEVEVEEGIFQTLTFTKSFKKDGIFEWYHPQTIESSEIPYQWINESDLEEFRKNYPSIPVVE